MKVTEILTVVNPVRDALNGVATTLTDVGAQLAKSTKEIIDALAAKDIDVPSDAVAALNDIANVGTVLAGKSADLKTASQKLDDLNPDAPA